MKFGKFKHDDMMASQLNMNEGNDPMNKSKHHKWCDALFCAFLAATVDNLQRKHQCQH